MMLSKVEGIITIIIFSEWKIEHSLILLLDDEHGVVGDMAHCLCSPP